MSRPFTRAQALENMAFLAELRRTGNARDAARTLGAHRAKFTRRRARDTAFAAGWDAALVVAHATLHAEANGAAPASAGEPAILRTRDGRLQLRRAQPGKLDRAAEQAFLLALSATANVRLSAAAAGFSHSAFYARRRKSPAFDREMRLALQQGYEQLELALLASFDPGGYRDDAWRHNDPPPLPSMTVDEALQLLRLHQKEACLLAEPPHLKRRRGESGDAHSYRLSVMYRLGQQRAREAFEVAEAARRERRADGQSRFEPAVPGLPALDQVRGTRE